MTERAAAGPLLQLLDEHRQRLLACRSCPDVHPPVICAQPIDSRIYLVGQAPGPREGARGRPFAHTAGQRLFRWFETLGVDEATFRSQVWMAAVLRCFPGKASSGGDRVPRRDEIARCADWMAAEVRILQPDLVIAVGRLAISHVLGPSRAPLAELVGRQQRVTFFGRQVDAVALPHPSGVSTWHKKQPGITLLRQALDVLAAHPSWQAAFSAPRAK